METNSANQYEAESSTKNHEEEIDLDFSNLNIDLSEMNFGREIVLIENYNSSTEAQITNAINQFYAELDDLKDDNEGEFDIVYMGVYENTLRVSAIGIYKDNKGGPVFTFSDPENEPLIGGPAPPDFGFVSCPSGTTELASCQGLSCVEEAVRENFVDEVSSAGDCATVTVKRGFLNAVVCASSANCG